MARDAMEAPPVVVAAVDPVDRRGRWTTDWQSPFRCAMLDRPTMAGSPVHKSTAGAPPAPRRAPGPDETLAAVAGRRDAEEEKRPFAC